MPQYNDNEQASDAGNKNDNESSNSFIGFSGNLAEPVVGLGGWQSTTTKYLPTKSHPTMELAPMSISSMSPMTSRGSFASRRGVPHDILGGPIPFSDASRLDNERRTPGNLMPSSNIVRRFLLGPRISPWGALSNVFGVNRKFFGLHFQPLHCIIDESCFFFQRNGTG